MFRNSIQIAALAVGMKRISFSLRAQLGAVAGIAALLAFWGRFGEYMLAAVLATSSIGLIVSLFWPDRHRLRAWRYRFGAALILTLAVAASFGPASWAYTKYDPGYWESPTIKLVFTTIYDPVGRCYAFPLAPWHQCCLGYVRWWMPPNAKIQDYGYGIGLRSNGGLLIVGG